MIYIYSFIHGTLAWSEGSLAWSCDIFLREFTQRGTLVYGLIQRISESAQNLTLEPKPWGRCNGIAPNDHPSIETTLHCVHLDFESECIRPAPPSPSPTLIFGNRSFWWLIKKRSILSHLIYQCSPLFHRLCRQPHLGCMGQMQWARSIRTCKQ